MSIREELTNLLREDSVYTISFSIAGRRVLGREIPLVMREIEAGRWTLRVDTSESTAYVDPKCHVIVLTHPSLLGAEAIYEALHECTHAMLVLTGADQPGMQVLVEIAATLLPIVYFFKTHPVEAESGQLFERTPAARAFVDFVREHRMFETSVQLSANDVQHLFAHVRLALARRRRVPTTSP